MPVITPSLAVLPNFFITLNDICLVGLSDSHALSGNIGHSKASLTSFRASRAAACAFTVEHAAARHRVQAAEAVVCRPRAT
jgi:hypothetical protein